MASPTQVPELPDEEIAVIFQINDANFNQCIVFGMMHGEQTSFNIYPSLTKHAIGIYTCVFLQTIWIVCG